MFIVIKVNGDEISVKTIVKYETANDQFLTTSIVCGRSNIEILIK